MIKNFDSVKEQLSELADVINAFKSEAVQLRIIELILGQAPSGDPSGTSSEENKPRKSTTARRRQKSTERSASKKSRPSGGTGGKATLTRLVEGTFFDTPKTLGDIIEHCKHNMARNFKASDFSGKLGRMVSDGELTRKKNADNQYEYKKP